MANFFDSSCKIGALASIDISSRGTNTYVGANSVIDDFVRIKHVAGMKDVVIGENSYINSCTVIYSANGVKIGNNVLIGPNCNIVPVNHIIANKDLPIRVQGFENRGGIIIEDDVWLGANVTIVDGVTVGKGAVIGAGSVVTKSVMPYSIWMGVPARFVAYR